MLAVVFGEASRSGLRFSSPSPLPGGILFAVQPLACSHAHALSAHCHGRRPDFGHRYRTKEYEERTDRTTHPPIQAHAAGLPHCAMREV